ncbi:hypothetical protein TCT1_29370 [Xenorhabdus sp. TCT-1]|uniref:Uncharacterized protein n=1 Tax=Xenorhabdus taiwanensis TaxID=3085177 RepID=A0ABN7C6K3_9GAMM|nr:hypothetical protein TCT1_29370 [Xenorhabdus sp. TCT-1]
MVGDQKAEIKNRVNNHFLLLPVKVTFSLSENIIRTKIAIAVKYVDTERPLTYSAVSFLLV